MSALTRHLLQRIVADPRLAYHFDPITRSMELLTQAHATDEGIDLEEFRKAYYSGLKFAGPVRCDELLAELRAVTDALNAARLIMDADGRRLAGDLVNDARAAIAKAEGRQ